MMMDVKEQDINDYVEKVVKHVSGKSCIVLNVAKHSETDDIFIIHRTLSGDHNIEAAPLEIFGAEVSDREYSEVEQKYVYEVEE